MATLLQANKRNFYCYEIKQTGIAQQKFAKSGAWWQIRKSEATKVEASAGLPDQLIQPIKLELIQHKKHKKHLIEKGRSKSSLVVIVVGHASSAGKTGENIYRIEQLVSLASNYSSLVVTRITTATDCLRARDKDER